MPSISASIEPVSLQRQVLVVNKVQPATLVVPCLRVDFAGPPGRWTISIVRSDDFTKTPTVLASGGQSVRSLLLTIPKYGSPRVPFTTVACTLAVDFVNGGTATTTVGGS